MANTFRKSINDTNMNLRSLKSEGPIIESKENELDLEKKRVKPMIIDLEQ